MVAGRGERHTTRCFTTGAFAFAVATSTPDDQHLVESFFGDVPAPNRDGQEIAEFSLLRDDPGGNSWTVGGPQVLDLPAPTLDTALERLLAAVNLCSLDAEPEHLHLHAAMATLDEHGVIIAAERNTGKTTTVAHLVARGWSFVTDETVRLTTGSNKISGFPKPLSIKPFGRHLVAHLEPWMIPPVGDEHERFRFVPIGASGATVADGGVPHLVVLLRRSWGDPSTVGAVARRLHPADAVVALMQESLDAERFGAAAERLAILAAATHCFELTRGTPGETADEIEMLVGLDLAEPMEVGVLPPSAAFNSGVVSVAVGDRAVVHDEASGRILALDEGATRVWRQLGGWSVDPGIDIDGPVVRPLVAQLRALGVLAGAA
jgi:hypothetical protein